MSDLWPTCLSTNLISSVGRPAERPEINVISGTCCKRQCLVGAVEKSTVSLEDISLLVLDECHHARGGHPLRVLMNSYMQLKYSQASNRQDDGFLFAFEDQQRAGYKQGTSKTLPQIIGLTASPGVGKARSKEKDAAVKYLKQLCARLDIVHICSVRQNVADLRRYVHEPQPEIRECEKRKEDKLKERLEQLMDIIEKRMIVDCDVEKYLCQLQTQSGNGLTEESILNTLHAPVPQRGQDAYNQWLSDTEKTLKQIKNHHAFYAITAHIDMLHLCQRCLILNEDCDSLIALEMLKEEADKLRREKPNECQVDEELFELFDKHTSYISNEESIYLQDGNFHEYCKNPKLQHLEDLLLNASRNYYPEDTDSASVTSSSELDHLDSDIRGMIFVRNLNLSIAMLRWMKRHPILKYLNPGRITGVNSSVKNGGMSRGEVTDVISKFNAGVHKVVICTSAAEEGLDFKACNLVIRYLYEASMVSMIQIRGRARNEDSRYSVLGRESSDCMAKETENVASELVMREAVAFLQQAAAKDPTGHYEAIQQMQREAWANRWKKDVHEAKILRQQLPPGTYRLKCRKCSTPACTSENIRLLRQTNRVVIGAEFTHRYIRENDDPSHIKQYDHTIPRTGRIFCKICGTYWGIIVRNVDDGIDFPVIPIKSFIIEDERGQTQVQEKWSAAFTVPDISDDDRMRHVDPLMDYMDPSEDFQLDYDLTTREPAHRNDLDTLIQKIP